MKSPDKGFEIPPEIYNLQNPFLFHVKSKAPWMEVVWAGAFGWWPQRVYLDVYSSETCPRMGASVRADAVARTGRCEKDQRYLWGSSHHKTGRIFLNDTDFTKLSRVRVGEREYPAPRNPEALLEVFYGPHWREPMPAFTPGKTSWVESAFMRLVSPFSRRAK